MKGGRRHRRRHRDRPSCRGFFRLGRRSATRRCVRRSGVSGGRVYLQVRGGARLESDGVEGSAACARRGRRRAGAGCVDSVRVSECHEIPDSRDRKGSSPPDFRATARLKKNRPPSLASALPKRDDGRPTARRPPLTMINYRHSCVHHARLSLRSLSRPPRRVLTAPKSPRPRPRQPCANRSRRRPPSPTTRSTTRCPTRQIARPRDRCRRRHRSRPS